MIGAWRRAASHAKRLSGLSLRRLLLPLLHPLGELAPKTSAFQPIMNAGTSTRLFLLNKALNGIDMFYEIAMPDIFALGHSTGIVLAKATYGNYLVLHQNCAVGRNREAAPVLGEGVVMYPGSSFIGRNHIGSFSTLSIGTRVVNRDTPGDCMVFGTEGGDLAFKPRSHRYAEEIFYL